MKKYFSLLTAAALAALLSCNAFAAPHDGKPAPRRAEKPRVNKHAPKPKKHAPAKKAPAKRAAPGKHAPR